MRFTASPRASVTTECHTIEVRGIPVEIVRKDIKNLHVGVYPPKGRVRVAAPLLLDDEAIRLAVITRLGWIRRQQEGFHEQDRQSLREMVTGESHYFLGRRYRLDVVEREGPPTIELPNNAIMLLCVRPGTDRGARDALLQRWYRRQICEQLPALVEKWEARTGVQVAEIRVKRMKTRWGTCNSDAKRIWLNLELVKKPICCLEYVLAHEMVHLLERHHNERFRKLMDAAMPQWRLYREKLNRTPLAHENWQY
ncbi:MAG: metal-dependent hydrolase [Rhodanobacter denitrificans]|uniref:Metal-dependent hydrolase n=1 Tax=Rhodanobacter denitrificans TaxID=666685 RepID=A0A2W5M4T3_9GAMM|nr:MAG: metal-dependent hydrolase [Rhodanobacter denitrificans]